MSTVKRFCRSERDKMICGVCGGLGEYFNIDSNIVRIIFIFLAVLAPILILAYIIACLIIPKRSEKGECEPGAAMQITISDFSKSIPMLIGVALVVIGFLIIAYVASSAALPSLTEWLFYYWWRGGRETLLLFEIVVGVFIMVIGLLIIESTRRSA
ncbi:PspC domain-containing protein [Ignisphaera sp. 4213-co]|uniref:PspC domain-containing protein n=1 Tax=Ignisphaera cupida TaxID=3050454 RepID=A0ABD4Z8H8_9CREN|nr:PspC domain-containing protein [Ignisphaera sp. 4213-co]MDK6029525.1 PspC domain-containing protein [Ignisphaera sp. 4213-co]